MSLPGVSTTSSPSPIPIGDSAGAEEKCICQICECGQHRCPHNGNLGRLIGVEEIALGSSEYARMYKGDAVQRQSPLRPHSTRIAWGNVATRIGDFDSTQRADFKAWPVQKIDPIIKPEETVHLQRPIQAFNSNSTQRADYVDFGSAVLTHVLVKPRQAPYLRPDKPFAELSTHQADYKEMKVQPARPFGPSSVLFQHSAHEPIDSTTTHQQDYRVFDVATTAKDAIRPRESRYYIDPSLSKFDATTTYQEGYSRKEAETRDPIVPRESVRNWAHTDLRFEAQSTSRADFTEKSVKMCPAILVLSRRDKSFKLLGSRGGHRYYRRVGPSMPDPSSRCERMTPVVE